MEVRDNLMAMLDEFETDQNMTGLCAVASIGMLKSLLRHGIHATLVEGRFGGECHCWNMVGDQLVDLTATQYDFDAEPVLIAPWNSPGYLPLKEWSSPQNAEDSTWVSEINLDWRRIISVPRLEFASRPK